MVGRRDGEDAMNSGQPLRCVCLLEAKEERRQFVGTRRNMATDHHPAGAELPGNDSDSLAGVGILDVQQRLGQPAVELPMQPLHVGD